MAERPVVPGRCPICGTRLAVQRMRCPDCGTAIEGDFALCSFCSLTAEQRQFAELFIVARGNLREMERMLGMSYPAVRARLESVIEALGHGPARPAEQESPQEAPAPPRATASERRAVLEALERGEIDAEEALRRLRGGGSGGAS